MGSCEDPAVSEIDSSAVVHVADAVPMREWRSSGELTLDFELQSLAGLRNPGIDLGDEGLAGADRQSKKEGCQAVPEGPETTVCEGVHGAGDGISPLPQSIDARLNRALQLPLQKSVQVLDYAFTNV